MRAYVGVLFIFILFSIPPIAFPRHVNEKLLFEWNTKTSIKVYLLCICVDYSKQLTFEKEILLLITFCNTISVKTEKNIVFPSFFHQFINFFSISDSKSKCCYYSTFSYLPAFQFDQFSWKWANLFWMLHSLTIKILEF